VSYTAWETSAGAALSDVQNLCRHAARANAGFSPTTIPSLPAVERWITLSKAWIDGLLIRNGLSLTQDNADVVGILQELNTYDACIKVELSLPAEMSTGDPNLRFKTFVDRRMELVESIKDGTLAGLGANVFNSGQRTPILTGTSISRKQLMEDDTDAVQHRVHEEQFDFPGVNVDAGNEFISGGVLP
jgi:hypothetical protein